MCLVVISILIFKSILHNSITNVKKNWIYINKTTNDYNFLVY